MSLWQSVSLEGLRGGLVQQSNRTSCICPPIATHSCFVEWKFGIYEFLPEKILKPDVASTMTRSSTWFFVSHKETFGLVRHLHGWGGLRGGLVQQLWSDCWTVNTSANSSPSHHQRVFDVFQSSFVYFFRPVRSSFSKKTLVVELSVLSWSHS